MPERGGDATPCPELDPRHVPGVDLRETLIVDDGSSDRTVDVAPSMRCGPYPQAEAPHGARNCLSGRVDACLDLGADIIRRSSRARMLFRPARQHLSRQHVDVLCRVQVQAEVLLGAVDADDVARDIGPCRRVLVAEQSDAVALEYQSQVVLIPQEIKGPIVGRLEQDDLPGVQTR